MKPKIKTNHNIPIKPAQHAEQQLVVSILDGEYPVGSQLPGERELSARLGVTRPTLREALQRLARDGWVTIRHGKPTIVNDYWNQGGMGILHAMVRFPEFLPSRFVTHLLEARVVLLPACADRAVSARHEEFLKFLQAGKNLSHNAETFADYDWRLQHMMVKNSGNMVYSLIFNDFAPVFELLGVRYFGLEQGRRASKRYYSRLLKTIEKGKSVERVVRQAMEESIKIWETFQQD